MLGGNQGILLPVNAVAVEKEQLLPWNQITESSVYFGHSNVWGRYRFKNFSFLIPSPPTSKTKYV